ncbi:MAG: hypothetical protein HY556_02915 [Euryarchaeota archaeon]|nr:hypothetical protein [Euryarchaeota archaeon]
MPIGSALSADPAVATMMAAGRLIAAARLPANTVVDLSSRYGPRVTATAAGSPCGKLEPDHFVEIVDYDPRLNNLTFIGPAPAGDFAPLHWLIHRAKREVNAVISVRDDVVDEARRKGADFTATTGPPARDFLELAMQVLAGLRASNYVVTEGHGIVCAGKTHDEVAKTVVGHRDMAQRFLAGRTS